MPGQPAHGDSTLSRYPACLSSPGRERRPMPRRSAGFPPPQMQSAWSSGPALRMRLLTRLLRPSSRTAGDVVGVVALEHIPGHVTLPAVFGAHGNQHVVLADFASWRFASNSGMPMPINPPITARSSTPPAVAPSGTLPWSPSARSLVSRLSGSSAETSLPRNPASFGSPMMRSACSTVDHSGLHGRNGFMSACP